MHIHFSEETYKKNWTFILQNMFVSLSFNSLVLNKKCDTFHCCQWILRCLIKLYKYLYHYFYHFYIRYIQFYIAFLFIEEVWFVHKKSLPCGIYNTGTETDIFGDLKYIIKAWSGLRYHQGPKWFIQIRPLNKNDSLVDPQSALSCKQLFYLALK